jgi:uncharacterized membrane protein HdeD (DUF308 family)
MVETRNVLIGVLAIILGILVLAFPLMGVFTASIIDGTFCLLISLWIIIHSIEGWKINKTNSLVFLVLGIIGFIIGLLILGNINLYSFFFGITFYLAGLILLIAGLMFIFLGEDRNTKLIGALGTIAGLISIILGYYSMNPYFVALIIGFFLIIYGIYKIRNKARI